MMKFKRRSFGSGQRLEQHEEAPLLDLSKDACENMRELLTEITKKEHISTAKRMGYLNNFSQFVRSVPPTANFGFTSDEVAACLRVSLINPAKEVRAASFRAFRYLLTDENSLNVFLNQRIDIFIVKSLDLPPVAEVERVQALRLVRKMVYLCPHLFPMSLAMVLSSISFNVSSPEKDCMSNACLATLCELAVQNIEIGSYSGVINAIISTTLDCSIPTMNESLISTILYLYNHPKYRRYVRPNVGLEGVLAPLTDLHYMYTSDLQDNLVKDDRLSRMENAKLALVTILKSWAGLILFCDPRGNNLDTLFGIFQLPNADIRKTIIDTLYDVFCLRRPTETDDFMVALESVDVSSRQDSWKVTELFLLAEANAVLPHRAKSTRMNVVESYVSLILYAFFKAGILESLVQVITTSDDVTNIRGAILLGELLHMGNLLLPPCFSSHTHCLPSLMALATNLEKTPMERGKASTATGYLDQVHQMKKRGVIPNTLFMEQLIVHAECENGKRKGRHDKIDPQFNWRDMDEVLSAINKTQVMSTTEHDYKIWNWDLVTTILTSPKMSIKRPDEPTSYRFLKKLVMFFKPLAKVYSNVKQDSRWARKYSEVALQITDFLIQKEEQPEGEQLLIEILQDISVCLGEAAQPGVLSNIFSTHSLSETLSRDYFLIIGRLSSTQAGLRILDKIPGIFQYLMEICSMCSRDSLIKVIVSCFDYGKDGIARILLSKALTSAPLSARLYTTKFLRVLLRIKSPFFSNWGIEFLTNQLYDCESEIVETAISILEEACEDEANLQRLIEVKPSLLHLGEQGIRLLSRYVSVTNGFTYLENLDYLFPLLEAWKTNYNREYVNWIELEIMEALSSYERSCADGGYMNRSHIINYESKEVYVLPHLYGELARHRFGIKLIEEQGLLNDATNIVQNQVTETLYDISLLKAGLWAIGHIGSTVLGINLILSQTRKTHSSQASDPFVDENNEFIRHGGEVGDNSIERRDFEQGQDNLIREEEEEREIGEEDEDDDESDIVSIIVDLAYNCDVLTIRGTCYFVLGLMARTSAGADKLEELGWECVRHKGSDIWPVQQDAQQIYWDSDPSEDENSGLDDTEMADMIDQLNDESCDRFGGVYLGFDNPDEELDPESLKVRYTIHKYGPEEKGKGKKGKEDFDDIATMLHGNQWPEEDDVMKCNMKMKYYDVDHQGVMYEKPAESFVSLERMNTFSHDSYNYLNDGSGIYFGECESQISFTEHRPPEYMASQSVKDLRSFEDCMPFISGKMPDLPPPPPEERKMRLPGKALFDQAGIYLGDEDYLEEVPDDSIEANMSTILPSPPPPYPIHDTRSYPIENNEPLKPIREEKSQENIDVKNNDLISLSVVKEITVEVVKENGHLEEKYIQKESENSELQNSVLDNSLDVSEQNSIISTPSAVTIDDNERCRSVSFTDGATCQSETITTSPRSSSFSGMPLHNNNKITTRTPGHPRADSDPGVIPNSLASSVSSQDSDCIQNGLSASVTVGKKAGKTGSRKKSRSENEANTSDRDRSRSIMSDSSSQGGTHVNKSAGKKFRAGSTLTIAMGTSPRVASLSDSQSPYYRGYTAWNNLRKQRSFRKEVDSPFSCDSAERRRKNKNLGYRRWIDVRKGSVPTGRLRNSNSSSTTTDMLPPNDIVQHVSTPEVYVGRCLPGSLPSFFNIEPYTYAGSWADNFNDPSEILQSLNSNYHHVKDRCLACGSELTKKLLLTSKLYMNNTTNENHVDVINEEGGDSVDTHPPVAKRNIYREVLTLVCNLSSAMGSKNTQQEMLTLRGRYPWAFQDLCLYSQVMELLGTFSYRLTIRRFIQFLFEGVDYSLIFETSDRILGRTSLNAS